METKRNIKKENEIINKIVKHVKESYLLKLNNYSNYDNFINNVYKRIVQDTYNYFDENNQKDPVMGKFCKYMVETFSNGRPWFEQNDIKKICKVENKLLKAIHYADCKRYAYEHIDEIENRAIRMYLKNMFE